VPVNAFNPLLVCTGAVASASCDTEKDAVTGGQTQAPDLFKFANSDWNATKFTAGDTYTVCKIGVYLYRTATAASYTITACIY